MPQYQGVWNLAQQAQALTKQQWVTDPLFDQTTLLLQADNAANGAQNNTFIDSSANGFAITRNGNTTQGSFTPFSQANGWWSNYFDGSSNLTLSSAAVPSTGAFTLECWLYITNNTGTGSQGFYTQYAAADGARMQMLFDDTDKKFKLTIGGSSYPTTNAYPFVYNTWVHVVFTRDGSNNFSFYINGLRDSVTSITASITTVNPMIGNRNGGGIPFYGYISNLRVTSTAVYSGTSFGVPNAPVVTVTGTTLLTCQSNRFVDNNTATTAKTFTANGTPSAQALGPFAPQYQWTSSVIGGSGYFDGTGDYLSIADNAAFAFGNSPFTVECWFYPTLGSTSQYLFDQNPNTASNASFAFLFTTGNAISASTFSGSTEYQLTSSALALNAWHHIALVRSGVNLSLFIDGARVATRSDLSTNSINDSTATVRVGVLGDASNSFPFKGYITDSRIVKGTAVYDPTLSTYTIPTAPLTPITNTQLLCNFTNAGIYDGAMKSNLETVGNAQISTTVKKYGSGALYIPAVSSDYLSVPYKNAYFPDITAGGGNFTVEAWIYITVFASGQNTICGTRLNSTPGWEFRVNPAGTVQFYNTGGSSVTTTSTVTTNAWYHVAAVKNNGVLNIYINGVSGGSGTFATATATTNAMYIGNGNAANTGFSGYIDDLRITQGIARYTRNFTPPQVALPRQ